MTTDDKTFNPNSLNDYKMTPLEVAIQSGEAQLVKDIANHPDFDYKQHRPSMFLQILEKNSDTNHSPKKLEDTKLALTEVVKAALEKDPKNLGHYTPAFLRDDIEIVKSAIEKDPSVFRYASMRLQEDKSLKKIVTIKKFSHKNVNSNTQEVTKPDNSLDLSQLQISPVIIDSEPMTVSKNETLSRIKSTREKTYSVENNNKLNPM